MRFVVDYFSVVDQAEMLLYVSCRQFFCSLSSPTLNMRSEDFDPGHVRCTICELSLVPLE